MIDIKLNFAKYRMVYFKVFSFFIVQNKIRLKSMNNFFWYSTSIPWSR
jgi:hypothetical protein